MREKTPVAVSLPDSLAWVARGGDIVLGNYSKKLHVEGRAGYEFPRSTSVSGTLTGEIYETARKKDLSFPIGHIQPQKHFSTGRHQFGHQLLFPLLHRGSHPFKVDSIIIGKRLVVIGIGESQRKYAEVDEIGLMDPREALGQLGADAEEARRYGSMFPRGTLPVVLPPDDKA